MLKSFNLCSAKVETQRPQVSKSQRQNTPTLDMRLCFKGVTMPPNRGMPLVLFANRLILF